MTIELRYRASEACKDTCTRGMDFLNKNLEKIVEKSCPGTGERVALYHLKENYGVRTVAAVEAYMRNARKGDYDFYVLMSGHSRDLIENESLKTFKRSLDTAVGKNGKVEDLINYTKEPAGDRRKNSPSNGRRQTPRKIHQIFSGNFSVDVQNLLTEYGSGNVENLSERMMAIKNYYAPKPEPKSKIKSALEGLANGFFGFLLLP